MFVILWQNAFGAKAALKMLVKLTPGINPEKLYMFGLSRTIVGLSVNDHLGQTLYLI
jgi:hypothetical protein